MSRYPATATASDLRLIEEAGGNIERACSLMSVYSEHFDGEQVIEAGAHLALRRRLGFPTGDAERKLVRLEAEEDAIMAQYARR